MLYRKSNVGCKLKITRLIVNKGNSKNLAVIRNKFCPNIFKPLNLSPYLQILENSSRNRGVSQSVFLENSSKFFEKTEFRGVSQSVFLENSSIEILWIPIQLKVKFGVWLRVFCGKLIRKNFLNTYPVMSQNWIVTQTIFE